LTNIDLSYNRIGTEGQGPCKSIKSQQNVDGD